MVNSSYDWESTQVGKRRALEASKAGAIEQAARGRPGGAWGRGAPSVDRGARPSGLGATLRPHLDHPLLKGGDPQRPPVRGDTTRASFTLAKAGSPAPGARLGHVLGLSGRSVWPVASVILRREPGIVWHQRCAAETRRRRVGPVRPGFQSGLQAA